MNVDNVLLFNGDLYMDLNGSDSDTQFLFENINKAVDEAEVLDIFKNFRGPFSLVFLYRRKLYFARDSLGRNSLIIGRHQNSVFISSVIDPAGEALVAIELPPLGVFAINIDTKHVELHPFQDPSNHEHNRMQLNELEKVFDVTIKSNLEPEWLSISGKSPSFSFDELCRDIEGEISFEAILENDEVNQTCEKFLQLLSSSVKDRIQRTPKYCKNCINTSEACNHARIGLLFSGGVDCSMLAVLADSVLTPNLPIDLMNVAFEKVSYAKKNDGIDWNVPDRLTGRETVEELRRLSPNRQWNFIETNITRDELGDNLKKLSSLVFPLSNVLDESLGAALFFASRGIGTLDGHSYSSPARVVLIGSGADELFGGYTRHRNAFKRSTLDRDLLQEELELDWTRLPSRNLARDDRVIADNGITVRAPFIEENFVNFVRRLKPLQRCFPGLPEGVGDKLLLRLCAHKLGLKNCSKFRKRALQFGSRIADKRQSAKDKSLLLKN